MVVFRAVVMLLVLVGLPAAWIVYDPLPEGAKREIARLAKSAVEATGWLEEEQPEMDPKTPPAFEPPLFEPQAPPALEVQPASFSAPPPAAPASSGEEQIALELEPHLRLLRSLGVSEYALRPWGAEGRLFRFSCAVPAGLMSREFDAVAPTAGEAVREVVGEVTSWQNARSGHTLRR